MKPVPVMVTLVPPLADPQSGVSAVIVGAATYRNRALAEAGLADRMVPIGEMAAAIREVQKGNTFFTPAVSKGVHDRAQRPLARGGQFKKKGNRLSSREVEVLQLIAEGRANKQVATELGISVKTVEKHRQRLMGKLNIHDTAGLVRHAAAKGIIETNLAGVPEVS